ncbi:MAG: Xaa-Pro aminopeptidase, partial [Rubrobacteraceae bacterium]|nr:Xaa-Pro aminopeptidase [Rubrobacteraceae bacterium]
MSDTQKSSQSIGESGVSLRPLPLPDFGVPDKRPELPEAEYENRIDALRASAGTEWIVVYGDREHFANLAYLTCFDPRFEEAVLVLGPGDVRCLLVGNEGLGYSSVVVVPRLDIVLCQSLSLMGQDRSNSPSLRQCLADMGIGSGDRVGVVGWKYFSEEEWEGSSPGIAVPAFLLDSLRDLVSSEGTVEDITLALLDPEHGLRSRACA